MQQSNKEDQLLNGGDDGRHATVETGVVQPIDVPAEHLQIGQWLLGGGGSGGRVLRFGGGFGGFIGQLSVIAVQSRLREFRSSHEL